MTVGELKQFLANRPDDQVVEVQYSIVYRDKGILIDLRNDNKATKEGIYTSHCGPDRCILCFIPTLKFNDL